MGNKLLKARTAFSPAYFMLKAPPFHQGSVDKLETGRPRPAGVGINIKLEWRFVLLVFAIIEGALGRKGTPRH
jgi:hypothetical protein